MQNPPILLVETLQKVERGLDALFRVTLGLQKELDAHFGTVGIQEPMRRLQTSMAVAWWLPDIVESPTPQNHQIEALPTCASHHTDGYEQARINYVVYLGGVAFPRRQLWRCSSC
jgi:hypothetical protein